MRLLRAQVRLRQREQTRRGERGPDPPEAIERVEAVVERTGDIAAIGIAGPGDPLANEATFETLDLVRRYYPTKIGCVSTNGLALPDRVHDLVAAGVRSITVTINAVMPETAAEVYLWVTGPDGEKLRGVEAGRYIVDRQWEGLRMAVDAGLVVKVNSVLIPGVNDLSSPPSRISPPSTAPTCTTSCRSYRRTSSRTMTPPTPAQIHEARAAAGEYLSQMTHCKQCRADACGLIGQDRDMETETLMARLGDVYEDSVYQPSRPAQGGPMTPNDPYGPLDSRSGLAAAALIAVAA